VLGTSLFDSHREIHAIFLLSESLWRASHFYVSEIED
jgi:hypothetical protein